MSKKVKIVVSGLSFFVLLAGCSTTLKITVERYDLGDESSPARQAYGEIHPPLLTLAEQRDQLVDFRESVATYKRYLKLYNSLIQSLFGFSSDAKDAAIEAEFETLENELQSEIDQVEDFIAKYGRGRIAGPVDPLIFGLWETLDRRLEAKNIETKAEGLETVVQQLEGLAGSALQDRLKKTKKELLQVKKATKDGDFAQAVQAIIEKLNTSAEEAVRYSFAKSNSAQERTKDEALAVERHTGDLVPRLHEVYQGMADPFLVYIAAHPENWKKLDNDVDVSGGGDTEYILVFENHLDGRLKLVTVDPTKVVEARLRISRRIAGAVIGMMGIVAKAYGVPIPADLSVTPGKEGDAGTIDYSRMTGEQSLIRKRNEMKKTTLENLRNFAAVQLGVLNDQNADQIRHQLLRRLTGLELLYEQ